MKYLVTGGSGFCGFEMVRYLKRKGHVVRVLDVERLPEPVAGVELIEADIRDAAKVERACQGVDLVLHTVAKVPISKAGKGFWDINVTGTEVLLRSAQIANVRKVVHISSSAVQAYDRSPVDESAPWRVIDPYARSKMEGEKVCQKFIAEGMHIDIIRPRTVLGSGRMGIFSMFFGWIAQGLNVYVIGNGENRLQFLHAEDLAACSELASQKPGSSVYNIGSRSFGTLREDLGALIRHAGTGSRLVCLPAGPTILTLRVLDVLRLSPLAPWHYLTYHQDFFFTNERAKRELGWEPRYGNQEALKLSYDDFVQNKKESQYGVSHRKALKQGILRGINRLLSFRF